MSSKNTLRDERELQAKELLRALRSRAGSPEYGWGNNLTVEEGLLLEGSRFEFVQAMRLLTRITQHVPAPQHSASVAAPQHATEAPLPMVENAPEHDLLTETARASSSLPAVDAPRPRLSLRLRSRMAFDFPAASVHSIRLSPEVIGQIEVIANLLALVGTNAPMPEPFGELVLQQQKDRDMAMTDFLDIFHHRLLELYYTTTLHTAPWLAWVHPEGNELAQMLYSVAGLGPADLRDRMQIPDRNWLQFAGLLWHRPRSAAALVRILTYQFKEQVRLGGAVGQWLPIEPEDQSRLGHGNCVLGQTATLGHRVWLGDTGILLRVGPMLAAQFLTFLPGGAAHRQLLEMVKFYTEDKLAVDLELELKATESLPARLGHARLGWTSWLLPLRAKTQEDAPPFRVYLRHNRAGTVAQAAS